MVKIRTKSMTKLYPDTVSVPFGERHSNKTSSQNR